MFPSYVVDELKDVVIRKFPKMVGDFDDVEIEMPDIMTIAVFEKTYMV